MKQELLAEIGKDFVAAVCGGDPVMERVKDRIPGLIAKMGMAAIIKEISRPKVKLPRGILGGKTGRRTLTPGEKPVVMIGDRPPIIQTAAEYRALADLPNVEVWHRLPGAPLRNRVNGWS